MVVYVGPSGLGVVEAQGCWKLSDLTRERAYLLAEAPRVQRTQ